MVALLLILRDCGVAAKNTLFKHFLRSDRPQLSSACTKNQLSNVPSEIFNLKRNRPRNLHEQLCNFREQVVRAGCKLLRANCQSKYQHCGGSLQSCAERNIQFDCKTPLKTQLSEFLRKVALAAFILQTHNPCGTAPIAVFPRKVSFGGGGKLLLERSRLAFTL